MQQEEQNKDVQAPAEGPGSELRGEPVTEGAKPGAGEREEGSEPATSLPPDQKAPTKEGDADVQEQPPRPPTKEDEGIRGRPGQQAGS